MSKAPRPPVFGLDSLMVRGQPKAPEPEQTPAQVEPKSKDQSAGMFRTSVYFARPVHDKLRLIAFEERKSVTDLINEGLDAVLKARGYPTTSELRSDAKA